MSKRFRLLKIRPQHRPISTRIPTHRIKVFFMGWIVLAFYGCDYVQNLVSVKGAANPFMFVVLLVGVQGVAEFLVSGILGGIVARAVAKFVK